MNLSTLITIEFVLSVGWFQVLLRHVYLFRKTGKTFNYRITDLWTATLCLSPLFYCLTRIPDARDANILAMTCAFSLTGTLGGLVVGRLHIEIPPHKGAATWFASSVSIFTGAIIGFFFYPLPLSNVIMLYLVLTDTL